MVLYPSLLRCWMLWFIAIIETTTTATYNHVKEYWFEDAVIDHYGFALPPNTSTFRLRFFVNDTFFFKNVEKQRRLENSSLSVSPPCLFYAGNEADIMQFVNHSGFLFEAAAELGALVVFAEHRYYGQSIPSEDDYRYLTVEQAMADFNDVQLYIRRKWHMSAASAFIAMGGSYGGNLAMWLRLKNPNLWAGAIASSATPLKHILRETNNFHRIETEVYNNVSMACPKLIRTGWKELLHLAESLEGRQVIAKELGLCSESLPENSAMDVYGWISDALETMVQYGYPYPTEFYNPLPGHPFRVACYAMLNATVGRNSKHPGLVALRAAGNVYFNFTGQAGSCYDFEEMVAVQARRHWNRKGNQVLVADVERRIMSRHRRQQELQSRKGGQQQKTKVSQSSTFLKDEYRTERSWGYQTCTEVYQPMPTDGITDFELPYIPNQTAYYEECWKKYQVQPRPYWEEIQFMGDNIASGSNIFLTHGQLDPWRAAGIQVLRNNYKGASSPMKSILIETIQGGAHHLDLRASHPLDPPSVTHVRKEELRAMKKWIQEWQESCPAMPPGPWFHN